MGVIVGVGLAVVSGPVPFDGEVVGVVVRGRDHDLASSPLLLVRVGWSSRLDGPRIAVRS